jgi:hypothetical protein
MDEDLRRVVVARAAGRCEYCRLPESASFLEFQIDHIIAEKHHGPTIAENLALACYYCNTYKGPNIAGWIPDLDEVVRLFHPRKDVWNEHFEWRGAILAPKSEIGQVTIDVLCMNDDDAIAVRELLDEPS